jgi:hypothetical protein
MLKSVRDEDVTFYFFDLNWNAFPPKKLNELGVSGNQLWHNASLKVGALVVKRSAQYLEFAVSQAGLAYLHNAVQAGTTITRGYLVLMERDGQTVVKAMPASEVVAALDGIPPRQGSLGEYWWLNEDGSLYTRPIPKNDLGLF